MEVREICIAHDASWSTAFDRSDQIADVTSRNNYAGHIEILGEMEWLTEKLHNYLQASQGVTDILTGTDGQAGLNNGAWDEWAQVMGALASESGFNPEDLNAEVIVELLKEHNLSKYKENKGNPDICNQNKSVIANFYPGTYLRRMLMQLYIVTLIGLILFLYSSKKILPTNFSGSINELYILSITFIVVVFSICSSLNSWWRCRILESGLLSIQKVRAFSKQSESWRNFQKSPSTFSRLLKLHL